MPKSLNEVIKSLDNFDWREIDGAIMDFQIHVREVTGGDNFSCVDSTELKRALVSSFKNYLSKSIDKILKKAKGCRPDNIVCVACQNEDKDNCFCEDPTKDVRGHNSALSEFDKNWARDVEGK